jgi:UDP-3-O-[3-hydroxymyristoyl] glucosamine N-acyltransferase
MLIMGTPHMPFKEWAKLQGYLNLLPQLFSKIRNMEKKLNQEGDID